MTKKNILPTYLLQSTPTVESNPMLNLAKAAVILRKSLKKKDVDEEVVIAILTSCSNEQRHEMAKIYYRTNGRNLEKDLRRKFCGNLESLIVGLIYPPTDYFARQFYKALQGLEVDANTIIEVLVTKTDAEIKEIADSYEKVEYIQCPAVYFANQLHRAVGGSRTDDQTLIRIIISRCEIDLVDIKKEYKRLHKKSLKNDIKTTPTVKANPGLNVAEAATTLRNAMKGFGTNEDKIIGVLTTCSNSQRQEIAKAYNAEFGRELEKDLRSELGGNFESLIVGLIYPPVEYLARQLNKAFKGMGTDANAVIEILITRTNEEIKEIAKAYEKAFNRPLVEHLCSETSGDFRKLLTLIVTATRAPVGKASPDKAQQQAEELFKAGEAKRGTSVEVFVKIFGHENYEQLRLMFEKYKAVSGHTIEQALKSELSGDLLNLTLAIVECVQSPVAYFAKQLNRAMKGTGTDDQTLVRVIVNRSEIDLGDIKKEYERLYDRTLESDVKKETSGDYKKALLALIGGP
ncbi:hypothetical protein V9T40_006357 [Parthenolecanium corni]|uniref:Annexin n=1 Tax=Parthenolecanium corni TaxID=536013 RepID=A0AAN9TM40_9HEMI